MSIRTPICDEFGIEYPIFAFCLDKEIVAEVSKAGGMGVLGALRFTPEELEAELKWLDQNCDGKPYGVDVVMPASSVAAGLDLDAVMHDLEKQIPEQHKQFIEDVLNRYGVEQLPEGEEVRGILGWTDATARPQVEVSLSHDIALLANALGPPPKDIVDEAHNHGVKVAALVGGADQARKQRDVGVDIIVAQGTEAAGHTPDISTMVLVPDVVDAVAPAPVLAAGGIGTGRQMAAGLALGAVGVWTGSIWLTVAESQLPKAIIEKLLQAGSKDTVRSRSLSGKPARQLKTAWTEAWDSKESPGTLPMPLQFLLTSEAVHRIGRSEHPELLGAPVGQIVGRMNEVRPTALVMADMVRECEETLERLNGLKG